MGREDADLVAAERDLAENEEPIVAERIEGPATVDDVMDGVKGALAGVAGSAKRLVDRGRYRKVRISRKGKPLLPDIPVAAVAAIEAASLYGAGLARVLALNVGTKLLFDVEVVNEADRFLAAGRQALLDGDLEVAGEALERAIRIDDTHAEAFVQLGVLRRLRGDLEAATEALERAKALDPVGEHGRRAAQLLEAIGAR